MILKIKITHNYRVNEVDTLISLYPPAFYPKAMNPIVLAGLLAYSALSGLPTLSDSGIVFTKQIMRLQQRELLRIYTGFPINSLPGNQYRAKLGNYLRANP
jgi:ABC-type tungstate transport system substrate-binding protein